MLDLYGLIPENASVASHRLRTDITNVCSSVIAWGSGLSHDDDHNRSQFAWDSGMPSFAFTFLRCFPLLINADVLNSVGDCFSAQGCVSIGVMLGHLVSIICLVIFLCV